MKWTLLLLMVLGTALVVCASSDDIDSEDNDLFQEDEQDTTEEEAAAGSSSSSAEDDAGDAGEVADVDEQVRGARVVRAAPTRVPRVRNRGGNAGPKNRENRNKVCRYTKGAWSECDTATNQRTRSLALKKGDTSCEPSKTITKKCKKAGGGRRNKKN